MKFKLIYTLLFAVFFFTFACQTNTTNKDISKDKKEEYLKKGQKIALQTFATLGGQLQKAMKQGGVPHAIDYCNLNAFPLVDSLSKIHNVNIRRASFKSRNPLDKPNANEIAVLQKYEESFQNNAELSSFVQVNKDQTISFFAPIHTNTFCLQCHGKIGETLKEEDYAFIKKKYPQDKAIGYIEGDLRGMWSITFKK